MPQDEATVGSSDARPQGRSDERSIPFDVEVFIDSRPIGWRHFTALGLCAALLFLDGFDVFLMGKLAPAIARDMGQPSSAMTMVFFWQQVGLAAGAFLIGPAADRYGRKTTLVTSCFCFGVLTLAATFAQSLGQLALLRGLSGIFLSGVLPVTLALLAELTPKRRRGLFLSLTMVGYSAGGASGAAVAAWLLGPYGWRIGFWIGGIAPTVLAPALFFLVGESLLYRLARNAPAAAVGKALRRIDPRVVLTGTEEFISRNRSRAAGGSSPLAIFREGRLPATALLWGACFLSMGNIALLASWMATFFFELGGVPIAAFAKASLLSFAGGLAGTLLVGPLLDRFRPTAVLAAFYVANGAALIGLGQVSFGAPIFVPLLLCWSFCQSGGQAGLNSFIAQFYPTEMRGTGFSWAGGAGRIGGVVSPLLGGLAVAIALPLEVTLTLVALAAFTVAVIVLVLGSICRTGEPALKAATR